MRIAEYIIVKAGSTEELAKKVTDLYQSGAEGEYSCKEGVFTYISNQYTDMRPGDSSPRVIFCQTVLKYDNLFR